MIEGKTTWRGDFWVKIDHKSPLRQEREEKRGDGQGLRRREERGLIKQYIKSQLPFENVFILIKKFINIYQKWEK